MLSLERETQKKCILKQEQIEIINILVKRLKCKMMYGGRRWHLNRRNRPADSYAGVVDHSER